MDDPETFLLRLEGTRADYLRIVLAKIGPDGWTPILFKDQTLNEINSHRRSNQIPPIKIESLKKSSTALKKQGAWYHQSFSRFGGTKFLINPKLLNYIKENKIGL